MPYGFQYHQGRWFGRHPADDLLEGWWCEPGQQGFIFCRDGRGGAEAYDVHPQLLAQAECMPPGTRLSTVSFPIFYGRWHGEQEDIRILEREITLSVDLARWCYREAGREMEEICCFPLHVAN